MLYIFPNTTASMPRPTRTVKPPKNAPPDPQSPSPSDIRNTQTPELKSTEIQRAGPGPAIKTVTKVKTKPKKRKADEEEDHSDNEPPSQKKSRKKITVDMLPLALRTKGMKMLVGAHVSVAKGLKEPHFVITTGILMSL